MDSLWLYTVPCESYVYSAFPFPHGVPSQGTDGGIIAEGEIAVRHQTFSDHSMQLSGQKSF